MADHGGVKDPGRRARWINPIGTRAASKPGGTSLRCFANINACIDLEISLLNHRQSANLEDIKADEITIISQYKEDLGELRKQLKWAITQYFGLDYRTLPKCDTIDKVQGGQNKIVILLLPPITPVSLAS